MNGPGSGSEQDAGSEHGDGQRDDLSIKGLLEAVLFLSNEPVPLSFFVSSFSIDPTQAKIILDSLADEYEDRDGGIKLQEIAKGYQFVTNPRHAEQLRRVIGVRKREGMSKSMMETLAIIAYKQPIVMAEVEELRGVNCRMMVVKLMERNLVKPVGRKELPGRPLAYGTTNDFLKLFGLNKLSDLPKLSEIKEFSLDWEE
jgi:segregation and condensation protein B